MSALSCSLPNMSSDSQRWKMRKSNRLICLTSRNPNSKNHSLKKKMWCFSQVTKIPKMAFILVLLFTTVLALHWQNCKAITFDAYFLHSGHFLSCNFSPRLFCPMTKASLVIMCSISKWPSLPEKGLPFLPKKGHFCRRRAISAQGGPSSAWQVDFVTVSPKKTDQPTFAHAQNLQKWKWWEGPIGCVK